MSAAVKYAHTALLINFVGRFLVKPDKVEACALELFTAGLATFEGDFACATKNVGDDDVVDDAVVDTLLGAR